MTTRLTHALSALSDAIVTPESWADALHAFALASGSTGAVFIPRGYSSVLNCLPTSPEAQDFIAAYVSQGWFEHDPTAKRGWAAVDRGLQVVADADIVSEEERRRSPYYQDFRYRWSFEHWAAVAFGPKDQPAAITLLRTARQGALEGETGRELAACIPDLEQIVHLAERIGTRHGRMTLDVFERTGQAAAFLDSQGRLFGITSAAESRFGRSLGLKHMRPAARDPDSQRMLQAVIDAAIARPDDRPADAPRMAVVKRDYRAPLVVQAIWLNDLLLQAFSPARAILLFHDTERVSPPEIGALRDAFGLTQAEARLAVEFSRSLSLDQSARCLGISLETARTHLKSLRRKMRVGSQTELAALLARLPGQSER